MGKEIENHIAKLDLDSSGFLKAAQEVLKSIEQLQTALEFKGAEKASSNLAAAIGKTLPSAFNAGQASSQNFAAATESAMSKLVSAIENAGQSFGTTSAQAEAFAARVCDALGTVDSSVAHMFDGLSDAQSKFDAAANHITSTIQNVSNASQTALGAATTSIAAKIASIAKVTAVVATVGVAIAAAAALASSKVRDTIGKTVDGIGTSLVEKGRAIKDSISGTFDEIHNIVADKTTGIVEKAKEIIGTIVFKLAKIGNKISEVVGPQIEHIKKALEMAFPETSKLIEAGIANITEKVRTALTAVHDAVSSQIINIANKIKTALIAIHEAISTAFNSAIDTVKEKFQAIGDSIKGFAEKISSHFRKNRQEAEELGEGVKKLSEEMETAAGSADDLGKKLDGIFEPLATEAQDAADGAKNLGDAMQDAADGAANTGDAMKNAADGAADAGDAMQDAADGAANTGDAMQNAADGAQNTGDAMNEAADGATKAAEGLDEAAQSAEKTGESAEKSRLGFHNLKDAAKEAAEEIKNTGDESTGTASKLDGVFKGINVAAKALGHDLGELPFKLKEISSESAIVGTALSFALSKGGDKIKELIGNWRSAKSELNDGVGNSSSGVNAIGGAVESVSGKFTALGAVAFGALERIGQKAVDTGVKLVKSLSVDQISQGWNEYELKMNSVQTIMAGTGEPLERVNQKLDELNEYADKTIYSFSDMTSNIGKFTNQGVKLDDAVDAIQGISNAAALAGANSQQASHAMYNFAQALSQGYVMNIDWKSIENAMMATTEFKDELIKTGLELGTLKKKGDQVVSLTKDNNGHVSDAFSAAQGFRDSLKSQWLTNEVLIQTLQRYSDETTELGQRAMHAAQDVKTASQLMDTLKEAVGSGWARTFEIIIGNFEEAKQFWTGVNNLISPILDHISDFRNNLLEGWRALGGREELLTGLKNGFTNIVEVVKAAKKGFETFIPPITAERIKEITGHISDFIGKFQLSGEELNKVKDIFSKIGEGAAKAKNAIKEIMDSFVSLIDKSGALSQLKDTISGLFGSKDIFSKNGLLDAISDIVDKVSGFVKTNVFGTIKSHMEEIATTASNVISVISTLVSGIGQIFSSAGGLLGKLGQVIGAHLDDILAMVDGATKVVKGAVDVVSAFISRTLDQWGKWLPGIAELVLDAIGKIGEGLSKLGEFLSKHAEGIAKAVTVFIALRGAIKGLGAVVGVGLKVAGVVKGISTALKLLTNPEVVKIASTVITPIASSLGSFATAAAGAIGPIAAVAGGLTVLAAAFGLAYAGNKKYKEELKQTAEAEYGLSESEKELVARADEMGDSYALRASEHKAVVENVEKEAAADRVLAEKLREVVDENGKVKAGKEEQAQYIIGQLQQALGIEIELVGGQITNYKELNEQLDKTIEKKRLLGLLKGGKEEYDEAIYTVGEKGATYSHLDRTVKETEAKLAEKQEELNYWQGKQNEAINSMMANGLPVSPLNQPFQTEIDQIAAEIGVLEAELNGTETTTGLYEARTNAQNAYVQAETAIANYDKLEETINDPNATKEEQTDAAARSKYRIISADTDGVSLGQLKQQRDAMKSIVADLEYGVENGFIDPNSPEVAEARSALATATLEYWKKFPEETAGKSKPKKKESSTNDWNIDNKKMPWKKAFTEEQSSLDQLVNLANKAAEGKEVAKSISKELETGNESANKKLPLKKGLTKDELNLFDAAPGQNDLKSSVEKVIGGVFASIGTSMDVANMLFGGIFPKAGGEGQKVGAELTKGTAKGIQENSSLVSGAGEKTTENYAEGGEKKSFLATLMGMLFPKKAAEGASSNTSVMQQPGGETTDQYVSGVKASSGQAGEAGGALVSAAEARAEAQAPMMGDAGSTGGGQYASGMGSTSGEAASAAGTVAGAAKGALDSPDTYSSGYQKGYEWGQGLEDGLAAKYDAVCAMAQKLADMIVSVTSFALKPGSPSKVAIQMGKWWGEGLVIGMNHTQDAVKKSSATLSETLVSGFAAVDTFHDILSDNFEDTMTVTPVLDLTDLQNGAVQLHNMLDTTAYGAMGAMDIHDLASYSVNGNSKFDAQALKELQGLREEMSQFKSQLGKISVRMDSGALVGQIVNPLDKEMGRMAALKGRR